MRNTALLMLTRIAGSAIGLLFWTLAARRVPAASLGIASATVAAALLVAGLAQLGLGYGVVRHVVDARSAHGVISLGLLAAGMAALGFTAIFLLGVPFWAPDLMPLRETAGLLLLFITLVIATSLSQLLHWLFMAKGRLAFSLAKQAGQALAAVLLLVLLGSQVEGFLLTVLAYTLATLLALLVALFRFLPLAQPGFRFSPALEPALLRSFARFSLANYAGDQFQRTPDALLPLVVVYLFGPEAGAAFFVAWGLGRAVIALAGSAAESLFAESARDPSRVSANLRQATVAGSGVAMALALLMNFAAPHILAVYGRAYVQRGVPTLQAVTLSAIPGIWLLLLANLLRVQGRMRPLNAIVALHSCLGIALSCLGMAWLGERGAGTGWLAAQGISLAVALGWYRRAAAPVCPEPAPATAATGQRLF